MCTYRTERLVGSTKSQTIANGRKPIANGRKRSQTSQTSENGRKRAQMVANRRKRSQTIANDRKWSETIVTGRKPSQTIANGRKWSETVAQQQNNTVRCPYLPGKCRPLQAKPLIQFRTNIGSPSTTLAQHPCLQKSQTKKPDKSTESCFNSGLLSPTLVENKANMNPPSCVWLPASSRQMQASASKNPDPMSAQRRCWPNTTGPEPHAHRSLRQINKIHRHNTASILAYCPRRWSNINRTSIRGISSCWY